MNRAGLVSIVILGATLACWGQGQADGAQTPVSGNAPQTATAPASSGKHGRSAKGDIGSGSGDIGKGAGKGAGNLAAGTGKGAADIATLHPVEGAGAIGKGGAKAGKNIGVGAAKGSGKIVKGTGKGVKHIF